MDRRPFATRRSLALLGALLVAAFLLAIAIMAAAPTVQAAPSIAPVTTLPACDTYMQSRHVYDCAGLLTTAEVSDLEARAAAIQQAGVPVVVYLQVKDATYDQTLADAAQRMAQWDVESHPGAKDGLVIQLNLKPGDLRHGQVALYAGATLLNGPLPQNELNRSYQQVMLPDLAAGKTASGIGAALDAVAADVRAGQPVTPPPPGQGVARALALPFVALSALLLLLALGLGLARRSPRAPEQAPVPTATAPTSLTPAVAGALITGHVGDDQMEGTLLDFARRGLLRIEPTSPQRAQIRLLGDGRGLAGYERELWQALARQATPDGVITTSQMSRLATSWRPALYTLKNELLARGWFDPDQGAKRRPLIVLAVIGFALVFPGALLGGLAQQPWPFIGATVCVIAAGIAVGFAVAIPAATGLGRAAAQDARNYFAGLSAQLPGADVGDALPWLVASGQAGAYAQRLRLASAQPVNEFAAIYPYWLLAHASMAPAATAHAGMVAGATGAAAGGGGAGGAF